MPSCPRRIPRLLPLLLLALLWTTPLAAQDPAEGLEIVELRFEGLETLDENDLRQRLLSRPGTNYDPQALRQDLKSLGSLVHEAEVRRQRLDEGLRLTFILRENPRLDGIRIVGNSQIETKRLENVLRLETGSPLPRDAVRQARERILDEYQDLGFMRTRVRADIVRAENGQTLLQILVNEGRKIKVENLRLLGNEHFSDLRLKTALETKGSLWFFDNYFDERAFEDDLRLLEELYVSEGFFDVRVERGAFEYGEDEETVSPAIVIDEGPRYRMGPVLVEGNTVFTTPEIQSLFEHLEGDYFDGARYSMALDKARDLYRNAGFITTSIADVPEIDPDTGLMQMRLTIEEDQRIRVGRVLVQRADYLDADNPGWFNRIYDNLAPRVADNVILREVTLEPGEVYDKEKEAESVERLRRLQVFDQVEIESRATDDPATRDVLVRVEQGVTGRVLVGVGFSDAYGAYAFANYRERNFLGEAGDLDFSIMAGTREIGGRISYFDRYLGDSQNSLLSEIHHLRARRPGYDEVDSGGSLELGTPINERWKAYLRGRLGYIQTDEGPYDPDEDFNRDYALAALRLKLQYDSRRSESLLYDAPPATVDGLLASVALEGGWADGALAKLTGQYERHLRLGEKLVWATDWQAGLMPYDALDIGPSERLYLGGTNDLRGFRFRRAGPHDNGDNDVPLGGSTKILTRNELRYPLLANLTGLVFADAGSLGRDALELESPRASAGIGLRLAVKNAQVGVDLALPINAGPDDATRYFHFNISTLAGF